MNSRCSPNSQQAGTVTCRIVDAESGDSVPSRIRLLDSGNLETVPQGHPIQLSEDAVEGDVGFQSHRYCYVDGEFALDRTQFPLRYRVLRGFEHVITEGELTEHDINNGLITIPSKRWSKLSEQGWYSGDIHIHHIAPETCRLEMEAEGLNVANILTSDFTTDQAEFEGEVNRHSSEEHLVYVSQEFRNHELGHMCLLNLKKLIEPVEEAQSHHHPLHLQVCDQVHSQGGHVSWAHFPSWPGVECPLDVAMEKLDGLEILCVLEPRDFPIFMKQVVPDWESNDGLRLWYRYLNCGFQLAATAGTDKMTRYVTVGANRVFGRVEGEFNYQNWIEALQQGRTFISNSPLLSFSVNGAEPGARLSLSSSHDKVVRITAKAVSQLPYHRLELICNGRVIADASPSGSDYTAEIHLEHRLDKSSWFAARALEEMGPYRSMGIDFTTVHIDRGTLLSNYYGTRRPETVFAHTSPVYVMLDGDPIRSWDDASYYVRYMDQSIDWLTKEGEFAHPSDKQATLEAFRKGRAIYKRRAEEARRFEAGRVGYSRNPPA
jgi:hypothetical protein